MAVWRCKHLNSATETEVVVRKPLKAKITKCYLVEVVGETVSDYYDSEYVFTTYQDAKKCARQMEDKANNEVEERNND